MVSEENTAHPDFNVEQGKDGIVIIHAAKGLDLETADYISRLEEFSYLALSYLQQQDVIGIVYSNPLFDTALDYEQLFKYASDPARFEERLLHLLKQLNKLHKQPKPVVGLIQGECSSLHLATMLWAQYRITTKEGRFSFPESSYGLLPGFGGTIQTTKLLKTEKVVHFLTQGITYAAEDALQSGLVDQIAQNNTESVDLAKKWVWQQVAMPMGRELRIFNEEAFNAASASILKRTNGLIYGTTACLALVQNRGRMTDVEALHAETQQYLDIWKNGQAVSMIRTHYFAVRNATRPSNTGRDQDYQLKRLGILGAGMMGSGIAYEAARVGMDVVLKDVAPLQAERGKKYAEKVTDKLVQQGRINTEQQQTLLSHIYPTADVRDLANVDLLIEAVFEDRDLKASVTLESLPYLNEDGFFASNTTSLPITELSSVTDKPENFIGMHFFSPVDRMKLVEIIRGKYTNDSTQQKALQVARQLGKIPIVVNDGPAFFTSRIFFNYLLEAITMLLEGIPAVHVETESRHAGFAIGPLAVLDEISLELMLHVYDQLPQLHASQQRAYNYIKNLTAQGRNGRKSEKGFYEYISDSGSKTIWQDPTIIQKELLPSPAYIQNRLLHVMALDSYRCLEENIITQPFDGDLGSVLGVGFPTHTGGVFGHIDQVSLPKFVNDCATFSASGEQWEIPNSLRQLAAKQFSFYTGFESNWINR